MERRPGEDIDARTLCAAADAVQEFVESWPQSVCRCPFPADVMDEDGPGWQGEMPKLLAPFDRITVTEATYFLVRLGAIVLVREATS